MEKFFYTSLDSKNLNQNIDMYKDLHGGWQILMQPNTEKIMIQISICDIFDQNWAMLQCFSNLLIFGFIISFFFNLKRYSQQS